jgi:hypothetical protein
VKPGNRWEEGCGEDERGKTNRETGPAAADGSTTRSNSTHAAQRGLNKPQNNTAIQPPPFDPYCCRAINPFSPPPSHPTKPTHIPGQSPLSHPKGDISE